MIKKEFDYTINKDGIHEVKCTIREDFSKVIVNALNTCSLISKTLNPLKLEKIDKKYGNGEVQKKENNNANYFIIEVTGVARTSPKDKYDKKIGERLAYLKAMKQLSLRKTHYLYEIVEQADNFFVSLEGSWRLASERSGVFRRLVEEEEDKLK